MNTQTAAQKINELHFMPGWKLRAVPMWRGTVYVSCEVDTYNSNREQALRGYPQRITIAPDTLMDISSVDADEELYAQVLAFALEVFTHEAREFFRVGDDMQAPFHPHRPEGEAAWERTTGASA